ncbi:septum formation family protein [Streptomyces sp. NPDC060194]|uniref:septum formation family protein n=1 Tax=Streptomyces sp. NPDC060194 TaxID=3347069 RepID=UPI00365578EB
MKKQSMARRAQGLAAVTALLALGAVGCGGMVESAKAGAEKVARQRSVFGLKPGDCFNTNDGRTEGEAFSVEVVPCDEPHQSQVSGEFEVDERKFPGDRVIEAMADETCARLEQEFAPDTWALAAEGVESFSYTPTKASWTTGDRLVSCTLAKESADLKGSLEADDAGMEPGAADYLKTSGKVYDALWANQPEGDDPAEDMKGYTAQAEAVATALTDHVAALEKIEGPVAESLLVQQSKALAHWKKAASAQDADAFFVAYDPAFDGLDPARSIGLRKELGLSTTVPADDADVWAG